MGTNNKRPLRVLAADDSAVMRSVMWKLFLMHAEERRSELPRMELCGVARDGVECLELVQRLGPDILVLDLEMPKLNGLEVLDKLRIESPELPVIMCSAYTEHGARSTLEALARGASDYVTKPTEQRDFAAAMQSLSQQLLPRIAALAKDANGSVEKAGRGVSSDYLQKARSGESHAKATSPIEAVVIGLSTGGALRVRTAASQAAEGFSSSGVDRAAHAEVVYWGAGGEAGQMLCAECGAGL